MLVLDHAHDPLLDARPLDPVEMVLVAHRHHPIHERKRPRNRLVLSEYVEVSVADSGLRDHERMRRLYVGSPQVVELTDFHAKLSALTCGVGFGWLPMHLASGAISRGDLRPVGFDEGDRYTFGPHLVTRRDAPLGRGGQLFLELFEEEIAAEHARSVREVRAAKPTKRAADGRGAAVRRRASS